MKYFKSVWKSTRSRAAGIASEKELTSQGVIACVHDVPNYLCTGGIIPPWRDPSLKYPPCEGAAYDFLRYQHEAWQYYKVAEVFKLNAPDA